MKIEDIPQGMILSAYESKQKMKLISDKEGMSDSEYRGYYRGKETPVYLVIDDNRKFFGRKTPPDEIEVVLRWETLRKEKKHGNIETKTEG